MTETKEEGGPERLVFQVFNEIGIIKQLGRTQLERALPDGLKMPHFTVLNHFVRLGGERTPQDLARSFQVTKGTMTNTLQRLDARNLIAIRVNPKDGRSKIVTITDEGRTMHERAIAAIIPKFERLLQQMDSQDFAAALPFLTTLRQVLDTDPDRNAQSD